MKRGVTEGFRMLEMIGFVVVVVWCCLPFAFAFDGCVCCNPGYRRIKLVSSQKPYKPYNR
ncbi:hypothetical protein SCA6_016806 [Theobroma cacao]